VALLKRLGYSSAEFVDRVSVCLPTTFARDAAASRGTHRRGSRPTRASSTRRKEGLRNPLTA